jgi:hypothetical protein
MTSREATSRRVGFCGTGKCRGETDLYLPPRSSLTGNNRDSALAPDSSRRVWFTELNRCPGLTGPSSGDKQMARASAARSNTRRSDASLLLPRGSTRRAARERVQPTTDPTLAQVTRSLSRKALVRRPRPQGLGLGGDGTALRRHPHESARCAARPAFGDKRVADRPPDGGPVRDAGLDGAPRREGPRLRPRSSGQGSRPAACTDP